jgi:hypothetical protein
VDGTAPQRQLFKKGWRRPSRFGLIDLKVVIPDRARMTFLDLFEASTEQVVDEVLARNLAHFGSLAHWWPLDHNESNFGVIENQQSSPIAAIIEKITNSIDAILMRKCYEAGVDPKSSAAPKSMEEAIRLFFHPENEAWYLGPLRQKQAEEIQILADGPRMNTSLVIYDNGEGQHPKDFETTFLSLLKGNKNEIPFVQGKYNMGGTGAIVFCGKRRYQLIGSKKYDGTGNFGFTLVRKHPLTEAETQTRKNTWYEYLKIDGEIPNFPIGTLDLGLKGRLFTTGTVVKLYSYDLPGGARSVISRDLNQSINEFLFEPALPIYTIDKPERYPLDKNLARELFGLKRRLEQDDSKYIEDSFSEDYESAEIGKTKITCYIFKNKVEGKSVKESRETIEREFFKNNMSVMFSVNGQVHGHYTSEFITRSLKMPLLKSYLLIHVDCTHMRMSFRNELFMASRDRLKGADETRMLRDLLTDLLSKGKLQEIYKQRKDSISLEPGDTKDTNELLRAFTKSMPLNSDLFKLLSNTFKLDIPKEPPSKGETQKKKDEEKEKRESFKPNRFPSFFKLKNQSTEEKPAAKVPLNGARSVKFLTDVENQYFDRTKDPGDLRISLVSLKRAVAAGGTEPVEPGEPTEPGGPAEPKDLSDLLDIRKASPSDGTIKIVFSPAKHAQLDDLIQIRAELDGHGAEYEECFWVRIVDEEKPKEKHQTQEETKQENFGLPQPILVYQEKKESFKSWEDCAGAGVEMDHYTVVFPLVTGEQLEAIYINMDSHVLKSHKGRTKAITEEQLKLADKKYISSVYFHTLFLFAIAKNRNYSMKQNDQERDLADFIKDMFSSPYSEFLLNFGTEQLMASLEI